MIHASMHENDIRRVVRAPGTGDRVVRGIATLEEAADSSLYFINQPVTARLRERFAALRGCIAIAFPGAASSGDWGDCIVLENDEPRAAIGRVLGFVRDEGLQAPLLRERVVAPSAVVSPLALLEGCVEIGEGAVIEPFCIIGPDVRIGSGSVVQSGVRLYPRVEIGADTVIGTNSVLGHAGFGFVRDDEGNKVRIPHLGGVVIGSNVEVGALSIIQGGVINPTVLEDHVKLGDHNTVGHNVRIGRAASLPGGVGLGGRAVIETEAWVGLHATVRDGARVGARALVGMDASVQKDVPPDAYARTPRSARAQVRLRADVDPRSIGFNRNR